MAPKEGPKGSQNRGKSVKNEVSNRGLKKYSQKVDEKIPEESVDLPAIEEEEPIEEPPKKKRKEEKIEEKEEPPPKKTRAKSKAPEPVEEKKPTRSWRPSSELSTTFQTEVQLICSIPSI